MTGDVYVGTLLCLLFAYEQGRMSGKRRRVQAGDGGGQGLAGTGTGKRWHGMGEDGCGIITGLLMHKNRQHTRTDGAQGHFN